LDDVRLRPPSSLHEAGEVSMFGHLTPRIGFVRCLVLAGLLPGTVSAQTFPPPPPCPSSSVQAMPQPLTLADLIRLTLERSPRLAQAAFAIDASKGRALQAGLYPNPTVRVSDEELGDRTGPGGILTAPLVSQEIITAHKLGLSRAAAYREVDQA